MHTHLRKPITVNDITEYYLTICEIKKQLQTNPCFSLTPSDFISSFDVIAVVGEMRVLSRTNHDYAERLMSKKEWFWFSKRKQRKVMKCLQG